MLDTPFYRALAIVEYTATQQKELIRALIASLEGEGRRRFLEIFRATLREHSLTIEFPEDEVGLSLGALFDRDHDHWLALLQALTIARIDCCPLKSYSPFKKPILIKIVNRDNTVYYADVFHEINSDGILIWDASFL